MDFAATVSSEALRIPFSTDHSSGSPAVARPRFATADSPPATATSPSLFAHAPAHAQGCRRAASTVSASAAQRNEPDSRGFRPAILAHSHLQQALGYAPHVDEMKRNIVIFLIIILLFIVIAAIGFVIYIFQSRLGIRPGSSTSSGASTIA